MMFKLLLGLCATLPALVTAADAAVTRFNLDRTKNVVLTLRDDRPIRITLNDNDGWSQSLNLAFEGTYGSNESLPVEYFRVTRPSSRSARGSGAMKVVVSYARSADYARIGGVTVHGEYGLCPDALAGKDACDLAIEQSRRKSAGFDKEGFYYSDGASEPNLPLAGGSGEERVPFCTAEEGLESLSDAICRLNILDIYQPIQKWAVFFSAIDQGTNYSSGSNFSFAKFGEADGNGIQLDKEKEPSCIAEGTCVVFTGRLKYWRSKRSYFAVEIRLKDGRPESAVARSLSAFGGKVMIHPISR